MSRKFRCLPKSADIEDTDLRLLAHLIRNPITGMLYKRRFQIAMDLCPQSADRALEIGYGMGFLAYALAPRTREYLAVDIHPWHMEVEHSLREAGINNVTCQRGDARQLDHIPDASLDFVVSVSCLEHVKERDDVQREIRRVLKPGGCAVHGMPFRNRCTGVLLGLAGYNQDEIHPTTPAMLMESAAAAGFFLDTEIVYPSAGGRWVRLYWVGRFVRERNGA